MSWFRELGKGFVGCFFVLFIVASDFFFSSCENERALVCVLLDTLTTDNQILFSDLFVI